MSAHLSQKAKDLLKEFKSNRFAFGKGALTSLPGFVAAHGKECALIRGTFPGSDAYVEKTVEALASAGVKTVSQIKGARPNTPYNDVYRMADELRGADADVILCFGGGSAIDGAKAAQVLSSLGGEIEDYCGVEKVSAAEGKANAKLTPLVAAQTVASSASHLTKYANITDMKTSQKKLILDEAITPPHAVFDYELAASNPPGLTADGGMDGISHCLEVFLGASGMPYYSKAQEIAVTAIELIVENLPLLSDDPKHERAREAVCLGTDLGGYAIMVGGTNGGHLASFSLVDILPHGRACGLMNPYYAVYFAPAIEKQLHVIGNILLRHGYIEADLRGQSAHDLGLLVAKGMLSFQERIGFPVRLSQVDGFSEEHVLRALSAAKDPQLRTKLQNMPIPMDPSQVDESMGSVFRAAASGDLSLIKPATR